MPVISGRILSEREAERVLAPHARRRREPRPGSVSATATTSTRDLLHLPGSRLSPSSAARALTISAAGAAGWR